MPFITLFICIQLEVTGIMFLVKNLKQFIFFNIICWSSMFRELYYNRKLCQPFGHSLLILNAKVSLFQNKKPIFSFIIWILCYLRGCVCCRSVLLWCLQVLTVINSSWAKRHDQRQKILAEQGREKVEENTYFTLKNVLICLGHSGIMNIVMKWDWKASGVWCLNHKNFLPLKIFLGKKSRKVKNQLYPQKILRTSVHMASFKVPVFLNVHLLVAPKTNKQKFCF